MNRRSLPGSPRRAAAALCAVVLGGGCQTKSGDAPAPAGSAGDVPVLGGADRVHHPGELARARDYTLSVDSVKDCPLDPPFSPRPGFVKLGVEITLTGTSAVEVPANPFYATAVDAAGTAHAPTLAGCEPALPSVRVTSGQTAHGFVTVELPKSIVSVEFRYAPVVIGGPPEAIAFSIQR